MIGKIIVLVIFLVVVYFAWDFIFACCPMFRGLTEAECTSINGNLIDGRCLTKSSNYPDNYPSHNPAIQNEQQYNPGKDQYLTEKYQNYQNIPPSQRPWNP
jgi:hypothetical protein